MEAAEHKRKMEEKYGLVNHPKADLLYSLAWDFGSTADIRLLVGFWGEVEHYYSAMVELLKESKT